MFKDVYQYAWKNGNQRAFFIWVLIHPLFCIMNLIMHRWEIAVFTATIAFLQFALLWTSSYISYLKKQLVIERGVGLSRD